ncbi:hypothetical protein ACJ72_04442 [Emergomyces africanus]|uniref:Uncharacterized protein n=1 Tax=Emergomyces africanus TaxID=1955775 RepID=A0A1B7NWT0_9EURO|nr:hypothetical protein ACJ72_04442 [Emergomyces africanus]
MASTSQQQPQPSNPDFPEPHHHLSTSAQQQQQQQQQHNLAVAASAAAGYAADNHLAGLVEAATAAAGQDVNWAQNDDGDAGMMGHGRALQSHLEGYPAPNSASGNPSGGLHLDDSFGGDPTANGQQVHFGAGIGGGPVDGSGSVATTAAAATRQMRHANVAVRGPTALTRKRKRAGMNANVDPAMTGGVATTGQYDDGTATATTTTTTTAGPGGADNDGDVMNTDGNQNNRNGHGLDIRELPPQQALSDARAAGVHSAAALFRQPSATSKKYTRPPMSKMFSSLGLSPENFLHLQAAAKAYMLDEAYPERRDCVVAVVELREGVLDREGNGERFFGEGAGMGMGNVHDGGGGGGTGMMGVGIGIGVDSRPPLVWPRDEQRIISLVMPLLRRMVTNERQRQYAIETRKGGGSAGSGVGGAGEEKKRRHTGDGVSTLASEHGCPTQQQQHHHHHQHQHQHQHQHHQQQQQQRHDGSSEMELGLIDLLNEGYPTDWESIARSYDTYNTDFRLDDLGSISGLQQADWWGLVAAVDCHYQIEHSGNASDCNTECENFAINRIVSSDSVSQAGWRVGMGTAGSGPVQTEDLAARNYFATGITRDVSHIIRDNLLSQHPQQQQQQQPSPPSTSPATSTTTATTSPQIPAHQITIHVNTTNPSTKGTKRLIPRLDISADQCPDLASLLQKVRQHHLQFQQQHNGQHQSQHAQQAAAAIVEDPALPVKVWLEEGLVDVQTDAEWMVALVKVSTVDWMDGELRVIVEGGVTGNR